MKIVLIILLLLTVPARGITFFIGKVRPEPNSPKEYQEWKKLRAITNMYGVIIKRKPIPIADQNNDGIVNMYDLSWFASYWLQAMTPEDWLKGT